MTWLSNALDAIMASLDDSTRNEDKMEIKRLRKKIKQQKVRINVLEDMALGIKNEDLAKMYAHVKGIKKTIDAYAIRRSVFI